MKRNKKIFALLAAATLLLTAATGCANNGGNTGADTSGSEDMAQETYKIAIVQLVDNDAFATMIDGFEGRMEELGYTESNTTYDVLNAQGDASTLNSICSKLKYEEYDLIVPIVTPATQAVVNQELDTPVVFISVTNPVGAGIMTDMAAPDKNATGTSNIVPVDQIFGLCKELTPEVKHIGILYCSGETNAVQTVEKATAYLDESGDYTYETVTVANSSEVQQAASLLAEKVDAIYVPIDSTVQSAMAALVEQANAAGIPVYGSDPVMVSSGALACVSVSNEQLGARSAEMAAQILSGMAVSDIPAEAMSEYQYVVSRAAVDTLGITLPGDDGFTVIG